MPMLDVDIPEGSFEPAVEQSLVAELTDTLLRWEGADPEDPIARSIAWVFVHRPATVFVARTPVDEPRYRVVASVPEGQFDDERRSGIVAAVTNAFLDAEEASGRQRDAERVGVFATQVPEGTWGGAGRIFGLADIAGMVLGDRDAGRAHATRRLALVKTERDAVFA